MSLDILRMLLACDSEGCRSTTKVPIRLRQFYDDSILELRGESSAAGWVFMSARMHDKHFCPLCAEKHICPRNGSEIKVQSLPLKLRIGPSIRPADGGTTRHKTDLQVSSDPE